MSTENLEHKEAQKKIKTLVDDIEICMLITRLGETPLNIRPMKTLNVDDAGNLWFFNSRASQQYTDIEEDQRVQLVYSHPDKTEFLSIYGIAILSQDRDKINELWNPVAKAWFNEKEDPNLMLLKVTPEDAYYWDTKHNKLIFLLKTAFSSASDYSANDGVKGRLDL